jgi:hypothetical protein
MIGRRCEMRTIVRSRAATFLALLSLTAVPIARPALAQSPPQHPDPQPTGSARISGRVSAVDDGAPVRRGFVRLEGPVRTQSTGPKRAYLRREVQTDDNGAFNFVDLPAGSYYITAGRSYGFLQPERAKKVILDDGQALELPIRLERTGAIVGRIADRNGEGLLGIEVVALRRNDFRGRVTLTPGYSSRGSTNDLGQFRLFNLSPGEYFVVAAPVVVGPVVGTSLDSPRDLTTTGRSGFLTTYYPGTQDVGDARLVVVRSGQDVTNVNFSLASGPLARVAVEALDSHGQPLGREASATLNSVSDVYLSSSMRRSNRGDDGQFVFSEVPPGDYYLIVDTSYRQEEAAYVNVKVNGDVTLKVQTNSGAKLSGRFVVQGTPPETSIGRPVSNVGITATRPPGKFGPSYAQDALAHPQGTDKFELTGLRGPMVLNAQMSGALLASISRAGGDDLAGKPLDLTGTESMDDLVVVFTYDKANVEVTLTGLREPDDPEKVLVILFSADSARWHAGSYQHTVIEATAEMPLQAPAAGGSARSGRVFTFGLGPVVPGRYLIAAVPNPGVAFPPDRAVLERLRQLAVPVTLVAGHTAKVEVRVSR